jgi:hypothetical protein
MSINIKDYKIDESYQPEVVVYDEEVDGDMFPDRDDHLKKKESEQKKYKDLKDQIAKKRVRR